jgi:hypothetical protein
MEPLTPDNYAFLQTQVYNDSGIVLAQPSQLMLISH